MSGRTLVALALVGCGSLADRDYRGEVLLEVSGRVLVDPGLDFDEEVGVALLWTQAPSPRDAAQSVVVTTSFPARYEVEVFRPPDEGSLVPLLGQEWVRAAIGEIILFVDGDGDDRWNPELEPLVGGSLETTVLWVDEADDPRPAPNGWQPKPGFNLVRRTAPFSCLNPWELWLEELPDPRTDLFVGAYWPAVFDWDCDGAVSPPFLPTEALGCPPPDALVPECQNLEAVAAETPLVEEQASLLNADPVMFECLLAMCPEVIERFTNEPPPG